MCPVPSGEGLYTEPPPKLDPPAAMCPTPTGVAGEADLCRCCAPAPLLSSAVGEEVVPAQPCPRTRRAGPAAEPGARAPEPPPAGEVKTGERSAAPTPDAAAAAAAEGPTPKPSPKPSGCGCGSKYLFAASESEAEEASAVGATTVEPQATVGPGPVPEPVLVADPGPLATALAACVRTSVCVCACACAASSASWVAVTLYGSKPAHWPTSEVRNSRQSQAMPSMNSAGRQREGVKGGNRITT